MVMMIIRLTIESAKVIRALMPLEIHRTLVQPRSRLSVELATFVRGTQHIAFRDRLAYLDSVASHCRLANYRTTDATHQIAFIRAAAPIPPLIPDGISREVVNSLISVCLDVGVTKAFSGTDQSKSKATFLQYLLQCIAEIATSFAHCHQHIVDYKSTGSQENDFLSFLVLRCLPYDRILRESERMTERKQKQPFSFWASRILVESCFIFKDATVPSEITWPNSSTERILRLLRTTLGHVLDFPTSIDQKYGHIQAIADLLYTLFNNRPKMPAQWSANRPAPEVVKLVLELGFVEQFSDILGSINLNYPMAQVLVNSIVRPLESLTKAVMEVDTDTKPQGTADNSTPGLPAVESDTAATTHAATETQVQGTATARSDNTQRHMRIDSAMLAAASAPPTTGSQAGDAEDMLDSESLSGSDP